MTNQKQKKNREKIHFCEKCRRRRRQMTETKKKSLDFEKKKIDLILGPFWREEASFIQNSSNALKNNATMTTTMAMRAPFSSVPSLSYSSLSSKRHRVSGDDKKMRQNVLSSSASTATTESSSSSSSLTKLQGKDTKARKLAVPYNDGNKDCDILINEHAKQKSRRETALNSCL